MHSVYCVFRPILIYDLHFEVEKNNCIQNLITPHRRRKLNISFEICIFEDLNTVLSNRSESKILKPLKSVD
jgi:hypothetical protein